MDAAEIKVLKDISNTLSKIERDLHSIDISLGIMRAQKSINESREEIGFEPLTDLDTWFKSST